MNSTATSLMRRSAEEHAAQLPPLLAEARRLAASVVMGTHGRTGVAHLMMGSVAESVLRNADVPVMCVKGL